MGTRKKNVGGVLKGTLTAEQVFGKHYGMVPEMVEYYCELGKLIMSCYDFAVRTNKKRAQRGRR